MLRRLPIKLAKLQLSGNGNVIEQLKDIFSVNK